MSRRVKGFVRRMALRRFPYAAFSDENSPSLYDVYPERSSKRRVLRRSVVDDTVRVYPGAEGLV